MKPTKENTLYLTIKQVYFDQIIEGSKKEEYREIKDTTYKKYLEVSEQGWPLFDTTLISEDDELLGDLCIWNNGVYPYIRNGSFSISQLAMPKSVIQPLLKSRTSLFSRSWIRKGILHASLLMKMIWLKLMQKGICAFGWQFSIWEK